VRLPCRFVLGCAEIMMLLGQPDAPAPVFDTTTLHATAAVEFAVADDDQTRRTKGFSTRTSSS